MNNISSDIEFTAGEEIILEPGFEVMSGGKFKAKVSDNCIYENARKKIPRTQNRVLKQAAHNKTYTINVSEFNLGVKIYPSHYSTDGYFYLNNKEEISQIEIYNSLGQKIVQLDGINDETVIYVPAQGVYYGKLYTKRGEQSPIRLIYQRQ